MANRVPQTISVRRYCREDRDAVRELAVACADPDVIARCLARHLSLVADMLTAYYTDVAPDALWVADAANAGIVGYLAGDLRPEARRRAIAFRVLPGVVLRAGLRGTLFRCPAVRMIRTGWRTWRNGLAARRRVRGEYPAHFHIGISAPYRGRGIGQSLVNRFTEQAGRSGIPGIAVSVYAENAAARAFFAALGYREVARYRTVLAGPKKTIGKDVLILGRKLVIRSDPMGDPCAG